MLGAVVGGAISVVIEVAKCLAPPIGQQFSYMRKFKTNFESLKAEVKNLKEVKESVDHKVDEARRNGEDIEQQVLTWLTSVESIITEAEQVMEDEEEAKSHSFNLKTRYKLSKNAEHKVKDVVKLQQEGNFDKVSYTTIPQEIWIPATKGYESFQSRMSTIKDIEKALMDPNVNMVGVYGMGGIGKTMLVKEIGMKAKKHKLLDEIVFAHVSETPDIEKIQNEIADMLGLQFHEQSQRGRARKLSERISRVKKILIILDNIWTHLELEDIGIPFGDDHEGCKLLLTARSRDVLSSEMNCEHNFLVSDLNKEEALALFNKMVGKAIEDRGLQSLATEVANECRGLPISIVTVAKTLRNKEKHQWNTALQDLRNPSERSLSTGVQAQAYSSIELSYNHLEEEVKSVFILCSLMFCDGSMSDLLKYSMGLGLLQGVATLDEARDRLYTLVSKLKSSCLLLDDQTSESFSMHDVVRDVALSIASRDRHVFSVRDKIASITWPTKDTLKSCTAITFQHGSHITELPEGLECPQLEFFHICHLDFKIPDDFFRGVKKLKALDLSGMQLSILPSSILLLENLQTLCLDQCVLGDISIIGQLRKLEILSLFRSDIEQLPKEIGQLSGLKLLDLNSCHKLKVIPPGVLSTLSRLEELYMGNTFVQWDDVEESNTERRNASLHELNHLSHLTNLEIHIKDDKRLAKCMFFEKLERYKIYIGDEWDWSPKYEGKSTLKLKLSENICMEDIVQLNNIEVLHLDEVQASKNILYKVHKEGFPELKHLHVQNSPSLLCIVDSTVWVNPEAFPVLESFSLRNLVNLEKIFQGQLAAKSFYKLSTIKVETCDALKYLFSLSVAESLPQLETIEVSECRTMEGIFTIEKDDNVEDNNVMDMKEFRHLRSLTLKSLPQFTSFCSKAKITSMSRNSVLEKNEVSLEEELDTSPALFNEMVMLPNLVELEVSAIISEKIWGNKLSAMPSCSQNLTRLIVHGCGNLKYLFSSSIVKSFLHLQHLEISDCPLLREIIVMTEFTEGEEKEIVFPQLNFLKIEDLRNLTRFCSENYVEFPFLKQLKIKQCPVFKAFILNNLCTDLIVGEAVNEMSQVEIQPFFDDKVAFPNLEEMVISHLDDLKMIWYNKKLALNSFDKLKSIKVDGCDKLQTLFQSNMLERFSRLESLKVKDCDSLEEIFGLPGSNVGDKNSKQASQLKLVRVSKCQSLKSIFPASIARDLLQLEKLHVDNCRGIANFVAKEPGVEGSTARFVFPKLATLKLCSLPELSSFYPGVHTSVWPVLKDLSICHCQELTVFASEFRDSQEANDEDQLDILARQPLFLVEEIIPTLEALHLGKKEIMMICEGQFPRHLFGKLKILSIGENDATVFPLCLLERFYKVETLSVFNSSYKELFSYEEVEKYAGNFARIKTLSVRYLFFLKRIWKQDSKLNLILQNLESLHVEHCATLVNLLSSSASFQNLTTLTVYHCNGMINLVTSSTAKGLKQLRDMHIQGCKRMIEIVENKGDEAEDEIVFSKLEFLSLDGLESLKCFCSGNYTFKFPTLKGLFVMACPKIETFCEGSLSTSKLQNVWLTREESKRCWEGDLNITIQKLRKNMNSEALEVSADFEKIWQNQHLTMSSRFQNLKRLIMLGFGQLKYLFSPSIVRSFLQLQHLEISKSSALKEIITMQELRQDERKGVMFPRLNFLKIEDLENLTRFCSENYIDFPSLKRLEIDNCPAFKAFVLNSICTDLTIGDEVGKISSMEIQPFFGAKVVFPELEEVLISHLDNLKIIWSNKLAKRSFGKLKLIKIHGCNELLTLFPSNMMGRLSRLESLTIENCGSIEEIFGLQGLNFETILVDNLKLVSVYKCQSLKNIFQASIAKRLLKLEQLEIVNCEVLEEIVANERGAETSTIRFVFPKTTNLVLVRLPKLNSFYPGVHTSEWPVLKKLVVADCKKVKTFASEMLGFQKTYNEGQLDIPPQQPLFFVEKIIPGVEILLLSMKDFMMICHGRFASDLFSNLSTLIIGENEADVFLLALLDRFQNLNGLTLGFSSYKELLSFEDVERHAGNFARIKILRLENLPNLKHMWKQDCRLNSILQNFEILEIENCKSLVNLVPSSASFQNLTTLKVYYCGGMTNLVTSSTAKSLKQLRQMEIQGCKRINEVVANEGDGAEDVIVFDKLDKLSLVGLESLTSFCSANYTFQFPSLDVLIVRDCPKMKIFCEGALSTPELKMLCKNWEEWGLDRGCWETDLNTTTQLLNQNVQRSAEDSGQPSEDHLE